jgi:hypothetical protein
MDPVNMDDHFQYNTDERVDLLMYQLLDNRKGIWYDAIREAARLDPLYCYTVQEAYNGKYESQWQILGRILYQKGEGDTDCIYIPPTAYSDDLIIRDEIMGLTHQELAHFGPNKCYQYAKVYFFWYSMCRDFMDLCYRCHLC